MGAESGLARWMAWFLVPAILGSGTSTELCHLVIHLTRLRKKEKQYTHWRNADLKVFRFRQLRSSRGKWAVNNYFLPG